MPKVELQPFKETNALKELDQDTFALWGQDLTFQQYRAREMILRETPQCRRAFRIWALLKGKTRLATVEAFSLPFVFRGLRYVAWNLTRFFVPTQERAKGYATELMQQMIGRAKVERISMMLIFATPENEPHFKKMGFISHPHQVASAPIHDRFYQWPAGVVPADERSPLSQRSGTELAFVVDEALTFWHRARSHFFARVYDCKASDVSGARLRGSHVLWTPSWDNASLRLLYRSVAPEEVSVRLMNSSFSHAQKYGLKSVQWWTTATNIKEEPFAESLIQSPLIPMTLAIDPEIPHELFKPQDSILWV